MQLSRMPGTSQLRQCSTQSASTRMCSAWNRPSATPRDREMARSREMTSPACCRIEAEKTSADSICQKSEASCRLRAMSMLKKAQSASITTGAPAGLLGRTGLLGRPVASVPPPRAGPSVSEGWRPPGGAREVPAAAEAAPKAGTGCAEEMMGTARVVGAACRRESISARSAYHRASRDVPRVVTR
eukprot:scaffold23186_cov112-Isochrysis_galbana.AAC.8